ncbi:hypothetical protein [Agromyces mangrovi Wang et al. 2018]|uniref:hypothetical protein n=1 Tax=Agromyces mangrovi TaxID=1858653 RepID=UPI0025743F06|nr:hypothetical protein [Agromyces mangrovi]BDZ63295.1 hypothetical protein GCM10025877_02330 [Agromyces mangrovi]
MNTRNGIRRARTVRASAGIALAASVALAVTACGAGATGPQAPGSGGGQAARPAYVSHLAPADRLEQAILQEVEHRRALAEEYSGLPADRIEQRLAAETGRTARSLKECAALALAQRPLVTADTAERLIGVSC